MLGVFPAWKYEDSSVDLMAGERLLLFTDGIAEASPLTDRNLARIASQTS